MDKLRSHAGKRINFSSHADMWDSVERWLLVCSEINNKWDKLNKMRIVIPRSMSISMIPSRSHYQFACTFFILLQLQVVRNGDLVSGDRLAGPFQDDFEGSLGPGESNQYSLHV
jgi:hypothetical protein